jgi:hypothetical protein
MEMEVLREGLAPGVKTMGRMKGLWSRATPDLDAKGGGAAGIRDIGLLESALAQPKAIFAGEDPHGPPTRGTSRPPRRTEAPSINAS